MRLSKLNFLVMLGIFFLVVIALSFLLIFFTPIKEFIPGYTSTGITQQVVNNALKADSLSREISLWNNYLGNLRTILSGGIPDPIVSDLDTTSSAKAFSFDKSAEDSALRMQIEATLQGGHYDESRHSMEAKRFVLLAPLRGHVSASYDAAKGHCATDIVAQPEAPIMAVSDGVVVMVTWDASFGNTVVLQHADGLLSIYKHADRVLRGVGDYVRGGEAIAIVGNTGILTTGPHLHFELWMHGRALDAEQYINF